MQYKIFLHITCSFILFLFSAGSNARQSFDVPRMISQADLVFHGEVTSVDYRNAEQGVRDELPMPYTFVTYQIKEILSGRYDENEITLRFIGGLANAEEGDIVSVSHLPLFDVRDNDIIAVKNNTENICPIVNCQLGRMRLINGLAYMDEGRKLLQAHTGDIMPGEFTVQQEILTHNMGGIPIELHLSEDEKKDIAEESLNTSDEKPDQPQAEHLTTEALLKLIRSYGVDGSGKTVVTANINQSFQDIDLSPEPPPISK